MRLNYADQIIMHTQMIKCLIADDSDPIRSRLKDLISKTDGIELAAEAEDGDKALRLINELKPEIIILDIRMKKMNGITVLDKMRKEAYRQSNTKEKADIIKAAASSPAIIIFSNYLNERYMKRCAELGAGYYFSKSEGLGQIKSVFDEVLGSRGSKPAEIII